LTRLLIYVKVIKNNKTYPERWRDWPFETQQPAVKLPGANSSRKIPER